MQTIQEKHGMLTLPHTFYYTDLKRWWDYHHDLGGSVYECNLPWDFFPDFSQPLKKLFTEFANIDFTHIENFQYTDIFNNTMPHRELMEDAAKIWFLYTNIKDGVGIKFNPQIIHEPWHDRYRVHPGSGRLASMWLAELNNVTCVYTHFDEPCFEPPEHSILLHDIEGMVLSMFGPTASRMRADIETYQAFPTDEFGAGYTKERDSEWDWTQVTTNKDWQFVRYSEGQSFVESKHQWRESVIDLWYTLNSHDNDLISRLEM